MHDNLKINVREYRRDNQNGQSRETGNKTKKNSKNTAQYVLNIITRKQKNNVNKT